MAYFRAGVWPNVLVPFRALMSNGFPTGYNDCLEDVGGANAGGGRAKGVRPGAMDCRIVFGRELFPNIGGFDAPAFEIDNIGMEEVSPLGFNIVSRRTVMLSGR
jgi:hypothetical protein